jgi:translation initiation factor eIF-2B subunit alpha
MTALRFYSVSFKFRRLFPLSQYDLPTHGPGILPFPRQVPLPTSVTNGQSPSDELEDAGPPVDPSAGSLARKSMSVEQIALNPEVDYTK